MDLIIIRAYSRRLSHYSFKFCHLSVTDRQRLQAPCVPRRTIGNCIAISVHLKDHIDPWHKSIVILFANRKSRNVEFAPQPFKSSKPHTGTTATAGVADRFKFISTPRPLSNISNPHHLYLARWSLNPPSHSPSPTTTS